MYGDKLHAARSFAIAAMVVGGVGAVLLAAFSGMSGLVVLLVALAAYGVYASLSTSRWPRQAVEDLPKVCRQDGVVIVTDEWIVQEQPSIRSELKWTAITRVLEADASWLLFYGSRHTISLPKEEFSAVQEAQFRAFLGTRAQVSA